MSPHSWAATVVLSMAVTAAFPGGLAVAEDLPERDVHGDRGAAELVDTLHREHGRPPAADDLPDHGADGGTTTGHPSASGGAREATATEQQQRDTDAYSGGYQRGSGAYALPGGAPLRLADQSWFGSVLGDRFEQSWTDARSFTAVDVVGWYGGNRNRAWFQVDGEQDSGSVDDARLELLWGRSVRPFWDTVVGVRRDVGEGPERTWLALGLQGLAPYRFDVQATAYLGDSGRTALRLEVEYDLRITQRLVLQPRVETTAFGQDDPARRRGSGLASVESGARLRYEFTREFAPYIGIDWAGKFGDTADLVRGAGEPARETRFLAGLRWFFDWH